MEPIILKKDLGDMEILITYVKKINFLIARDKYFLVYIKYS